MGTKICTKCGDPKLLGEFHKNKSKKTGITGWCKKCDSEYNKRRYMANSEKLKKQARQYKKNNIEKAKIARKKYHKNNIGKVKKYCELNKDRRRLYMQNRRKNPLIKLSESVSNNMRQSLKRNKNGYHWETLVEYTQKDLRNYLEKQFKEGMKWENYGKWHLDHKIPISLFNITGIKSKGFKACWALENLQPLWEKDNLEKSNKLFY